MTNEAGGPDCVDIRRGPYPELTWTALWVGYGIGIVIAISIGYASLILGFSIEGSELAAILGFGILRGLLGRRSIVENNINQTIASAVNGASSGMMFTVPALFILEQPQFNPVLMVFACIAGGILGVTFIIPLRKQMIDFERLTYPGGVAVATILKSPGAGLRKAGLLVAGIGVSAVVAILTQLTGWESVDVGARLGWPAYLNGVWMVSLMTVAVGFIAGKGGVSFILGGYLCYWILSPLLAALGRMPGSEVLAAANQDVVTYMRLNLFRPLGIGMLIGGAVAGIVLAVPLLISAVRAMHAAAASRSEHARDEMPVTLLTVGIVAAALLLWVVSVNSVEQVGWGRGLVMSLLGTLWIWVAGVILSECIGRTNWSPLSGMTLIAVTLLVLITARLGDAAAIVSSIVVGAAACVAMSQACDLMMDLKTGYLVGAIPRRQQMAQLSAVWLGPLITMGLIYVLQRAHGLGSDRLPAPQAQALAATIEGILGGQVPVEKYLAGAGLGALLGLTGVGGLGILVGLGFYLPFDIVLTYSIGTLLRWICDRCKGTAFSEDVGIPVAAGLIVGEALVGVGSALLFVVKGAMG